MEFECEFCKKICKNKNSLTQHKIRCSLNDNKILVKSNFINYNSKVKSGEIIKEFTNQYSKANLNGYKIEISDETRKKLSVASKRQIWDDERRKAHSKIMIKTSIEHSSSYSANNVCGRTKLIKILDSYNNETNVNGRWEKIVADYLDSIKIKWINKIDEIILYNWENKNRRYYPDFYLTEYDVYIEVKGYVRDRDIEKWESIKERLILIKKNEINLIKCGKYILPLK